MDAVDRDYATPEEWQAYEDGVMDTAITIENLLVQNAHLTDKLVDLEHRAASFNRCAERGCDRSVYAKGWCPTHYMKHHVNPRICVFPNCGRNVRTRSLCETHYKGFMKSMKHSMERAGNYLYERTGGDWTLISQVLLSGERMNEDMRTLYKNIQSTSSSPPKKSPSDPVSTPVTETKKNSAPLTIAPSINMRVDGALLTT